MNNIAKLELLKARLLAELTELKHEYEVVKAAKEKPEKMRKAKVLAEELKALQCKSDDSSAAESADTNLIQRLKLNLYSSFTGLNIIHVTMQALSIEDDIPWFQYDIIANIEKLRFILTIISNQSIQYQYSETELRSYDLKELSIRMMNQAHQAELSEMVDFYATNPNYIGRVIQNLAKYYTLHLHRSNVIKKLMETYEEYLDVTLDNATGFYTLVFKGCVSKAYFITLIWSIVWNISEMALRDSYKSEIVESDAQFSNDVDPVMVLLFDVNRSDHFSEHEKFSLLQRIMIAVKDADTRVYNGGSSSNPSSNMNR